MTNFDAVEVGSAPNGLAAAVTLARTVSPFFADPAFDGLRADLLQPAVPFAHPLDGGNAALVRRSLDETADGSGQTVLPTGACSAQWCPAWATWRRPC